MHRVRQSLPYFKELGWEPVVLAVDEQYVEAYSTDPLLMHSIPKDVTVYKVKAYDVRYTRKFGLGSLSMRSYFQFKKKGTELLKSQHFDLVYFSTTAFHVMALGPGWKRRFGVPFILDIQDPWRSDFYLDKPKSERPPKFFISYNIDKYLERKTVPFADGIISVSKGYCDTFIKRYPGLTMERCRVIPFGAVECDFSIMEKYVPGVEKIRLDKNKKNIIYIGRGGHDMRYALEIIFQAFAKGVKEQPEIFSQVHFWFIGTSYAQAGQGGKTMQPLAARYGVEEYVTEVPDRVPYFETLFLLKQADALLVPGSTDTMYTASKIYPYIMVQKPLLAVFYKDSSVVDVLKKVKAGTVVTFDHLQKEAHEYVEECLQGLRAILSFSQSASYDKNAFEQYTAKTKAKEQVDFFNEIVAAQK